MTLATALKRLTPNEALVFIDAGASYVDLRKVNDYLDVHIPASLSLQYEFGPGLPGRARDCVPLSVPLILLDEAGIDVEEVAAALRGKGFVVPGVLEGGLKAWASAHGTPTSSDVLEGDAEPMGTVLDVGDPGVEPPEGAVHIPIELLWDRAEQIPHDRPATVVAGSGVRAAIAVGILERSGIDQISFWWRKRKPPVGQKKRSSFFHPFRD